MSGGIAHLVLSGPVLLAIPVAAAAGAVTFLSPCCLPLVPGYLSYVTGMSGTDAQRAGAAGLTASVTAAPAAGLAAAGGSVSVAAPAAGVTTGGPAATPAHGRTMLGTLLFVLGFSLVFATEGLAF